MPSAKKTGTAKQKKAAPKTQGRKNRPAGKVEPHSEKVVTAAARPLITITTDFGEGYYAGAMKGAILDVCPQACIVDITHQISSHDVPEAAFTLLSTYPYYPPDTIHLVVVDPGVGSRRRGIVVSAGGHFFVGPDNGVFSFVYTRERAAKVISIQSTSYFRKPVSSTFHGRDVFGPVAGWLARRIPLDKFGEQIEDYRRVEFAPVQKRGDNLLRGVIICVDKFGNIITSFSPRETFDLLGRKGTPKFSLNGREISQHYDFYAQAGPDEIFSLVGSSGYYEIAAQGRRAAQILEVNRGEKVELELCKP